MSDPQLHLNLASVSKEDTYKIALDNGDNSPNANNNSESIEVLATPSNTHSSGPLQGSIISSISSNNTDICVLENHYDYDVREQFIDEEFIQDEDDDRYLYDDLDSDEEFVRSIGLRENLEQFTVVHKSQTPKIFGKSKKSVKKDVCCNSEYYGTQRTTYSGTDSDVEVLVEEVDIVEPNWSDHNKWSVMKKKSEVNVLRGGIRQGCKGSSSSRHHLRSEGHQQTCLISDIYQNLNRTELLQIVKEQQLHIQALEAKLKRFQKAQQRMGEHVDALRMELEEISVIPIVYSKSQVNGQNNHEEFLKN